MALHAAAMMGHRRIIRMLLAAGSDPALPGPGGLLPLHSAVSHGHTAAARLLLDAAPHTALAATAEGITLLQPLHNL